MGIHSTITLRRASFMLAAVLLTVGCRSNISVPDKAPAIGPTFSMIVASDSQYAWWTAPPCHNCSADDCATGKCDAGVCKKDEDAVAACERRMGGAAIRDQIQAASKITTLNWPQNMGGEKVAAPVGVIVNGDLTAYFHRQEVLGEDEIIGEEMDKIRKSDPTNPILKIIPFLGLGNHDYRNNVCNCRSWYPFDANICARMAGHTMFRLYDKKYPWIRFDPCSFAYSWTLGKIRFVQLHLWPGYTADFGYWLGDNEKCKIEPNRWSPAPRPCGDNVVFPSWAFLESELTAADVNGERAVLLFHDPEEYWTAADVTKFQQIVVRHGVIAVFAGHYHGSWGVQTGYPIANDLKNKFGTGVPVILSGASDSRKFAIAQFTANSMKVALIAADGGTPVFQASTTDNPKPQLQISW